MQKIISGLNKFVNSFAFIYFIGALVALIWLTKLEIIGFVILFLIGCVIMLTQKSVVSFLPIAFMGYFGVSLTQVPSEFMTHGSFINKGDPLFYPIVGAVFGLFLICLIYHYIKYPPKKDFLKSPLFFPWIFCIFACLIAGVFSSTFNFVINIAMCGLFLLMLFVTFLILTSERENFKEYICHIILGIGFIMTIETVAYYISVPDFTQSVLSKSLYLGWGLSNNIAAVLSLCIPIALYLFSQKNNAVYFVAFAIFLVTTLFCLSRGVLLILVIIAPFLVYLTIRYAKNRKTAIICVSVFFAIVIVFVVVFWKDISALFDNMFDLGLSNNGRDTMWGIGLNVFKQFPLFGGGFYSDNIMLLSHCSIVQILACVGIFGLIIFGFNYFQKYKILFKYKTSFSLFTIATAIALIGFALEDIAFFYIYLNFMILGLLESCSREYKAMVESNQLKVKEFAPNQKKTIGNFAVLCVGITLAVFASLFAVNSVYQVEGSATFKINELRFYLIVCAFLASEVCVFAPIDYFISFVKVKKFNQKLNG